MEKLRQLLTQTLTEELEQMVISHPGKKRTSAHTGGDGRAFTADKVRIRPVLLEAGLHFQESSFVGAQIFHKNYKKEQIIEEITALMQERFGQLQLSAAGLQATALVSKKGTVTIRQKASSCAKTEEAQSGAGRDLSHNRTKRYILPEGTPVPFLVDLGVQTKDGKIVKSRYDKFRQINRFLEFIEDILPALPQNDRVTVLDFGCGKSYLTFAMYYYLKEKKGYDLEIVGLDLKREVIAHCNALAQKYGYQGLTFLQGDITDYDEKRQIDMVVTLHACDTATDAAIAKAITWNARVILSVPCCHHELNRQISCQELAPVLRYGLLKERMAALLTDGIRACTMEAYGYDTQVLEFIDMEHTPKNILLRGIRKDGMRKKAISMNEVERMMDMLHTRQALVSTLYDTQTGGSETTGDSR